MKTIRTEIEKELNDMKDKYQLSIREQSVMDLLWDEGEALKAWIYWNVWETLCKMRRMCIVQSIPCWMPVLYRDAGVSVIIRSMQENLLRV